MDAVRAVGATAFWSASAGRPTQDRLYKPELPEIRDLRYPTYAPPSDAGKEALERVRRANLAAAAAVYVNRMQSPG